MYGWVCYSSYNFIFLLISLSNTLLEFYEIYFTPHILSLNPQIHKQFYDIITHQFIQLNFQQDLKLLTSILIFEIFKKFEISCIIFKNWGPCNQKIKDGADQCILIVMENQNGNLKQYISFGGLAKINYNYMSKGLIPILTLATVSSLAYFLKKYLSEDSNLVERAKLVELIITLRKSIFSTLREIAYVANCIKIMESGIQPRKIKDIVMKDGATAQKKLQSIQDLILLRFDVTKQKFEQSCNYHSYNDIEVKLLLQAFQNDIQNAIDGTIQSYNGPLPHISGSEVIRIYRQIVLRRMRIIEQKFLKGMDDLQCLKLELEIEQYLQGENIVHHRQANEKVFIALLQYNYKTDSEFKQEFQALEKQFQDFIQEIKKKKGENS